MSITLLYTCDNHGNRIGVFLSIQDWQTVGNKLDRELLVPQHEQKMILEALKDYEQNKDSMIDWETLKAEMEKEDGPF